MPRKMQQAIICETIKGIKESFLIHVQKSTERSHVEI